MQNFKITKRINITGYKNYFLDSEKSGYCGMALYTKIEPLKVTFGLYNNSCNNEVRLYYCRMEKISSIERSCTSCQVQFNKFTKAFNLAQEV